MPSCVNPHPPLFLFWEDSVCKHLNDLPMWNISSKCNFCGAVSAVPVSGFHPWASETECTLIVWLKWSGLQPFNMLDVLIESFLSGVSSGTLSSFILKEQAIRKRLFYCYLNLCSSKYRWWPSNESRRCFSQAHKVKSFAKYTKEVHLSHEQVNFKLICGMQHLINYKESP